MSNLLSNMTEGEVIPDFYEQTGYDRGTSPEMVKFLNTMNHCDSYQRDNTSWRVQGWCYLADIPDPVPDEIVQSNHELKEKNGRAILEIWSLHLDSGLPF